MAYAQNLYDFKPDPSQIDVELILKYYEVQFYGGGAYLTYTGSLAANTQAAFNAITWTDVRPKPTWADISGIWFTLWRGDYDNNAISNKMMADIIVSYIDTKSSLSHTHAVGDITGLVSALSSKLESLSGSDQGYIPFSGNSDSNGELKVWLTPSGDASTASKFSGNPIPVGCAFGSTSTDSNAPHLYVDRWADSGKSVILKATKGHTQVIIALATTDVVDFVSSGVLFEGILIGAKA